MLATWLFYVCGWVYSRETEVSRVTPPPVPTKWFPSQGLPVTQRQLGQWVLYILTSELSITVAKAAGGLSRGRECAGDC